MNPERGGPGWEGKPSGYGGYAVAARDTRKDLRFSEWRFRTFLPGYRAGYYEIWNPIDPNTQTHWCLDRAYLIIEKDGKEYISLHCDPEELDPTKRQGRSLAQYKRGPHLHIKVADQPIPKAHIAMSHAFLDQVLSSEDDIFRVFRMSIEMICDEILARENINLQLG